MRKHSTVASLYRAQLAFFERTNASIAKGHAQVAKRSFADFSEFTSGPLKAKDRRRLGYPYGRGADAAASTPQGFMRGAAPKKVKQVAGRGSLPKSGGYLIINRDTGELRRLAYLRKTTTPGTVQSFSLGSDAKYAKYVLDPRGTKKMIGRQVFGGKLIGQTKDGLIEKRWKQRNKALIDHIKKVNRT